MSAVRDVWRPETKADSEAVLHELREVLASPHFCNSKRYPALLRYVVEQTLAGRGENLKERTLGIEVFGRPATYDTSLDTIVRYTAGEIRKRLSLYYHEAGRNSRIQIQLPSGSYVPDFIFNAEESGLASPAKEVQHDQAPSQLAKPEPELMAAMVADTRVEAPALSRRWIYWAGIAAVVLVAIGAIGLNSMRVHPKTVVDQFWAPMIHGRGPTLICLGGVTFEQSKYSGVTTAGKNIDYPFVSMQIAASLPRVTSVLDHDAGEFEVESSASTTIAQMRDRPIVLLGGYNNDWTMRLLQPLRFQFSVEPVESIVDTQNPQVHWSRDKSVPYSTADDYAVIARFRSPSTDSPIVVLAGLGRNGSEAAAQFATSPHSMQMLIDRVGGDLKSKNIEVVLKVNVIDGKTGAPSILAVHTW